MHHQWETRSSKPIRLLFRSLHTHCHCCSSLLYTFLFSAILGKRNSRLYIIHPVNKNEPNMLPKLLSLLWPFLRYVGYRYTFTYSSLIMEIYRGPKVITRALYCGTVWLLEILYLTRLFIIYSVQTLEIVSEKSCAVVERYPPKSVMSNIAFILKINIIWMSAFCFFPSVNFEYRRL